MGSLFLFVLISGLSHQACATSYACHIYFEESSKQEGGGAAAVGRSTKSDFVGIQKAKQQKKWNFSKRKTVGKEQVKVDLSVVYEPRVIEKYEDGTKREVVSDSFEFNLTVLKIGTRNKHKASFQFFNSERAPVEFVLKTDKQFDMGDEYLHRFGVNCFTEKEKNRQKRRGTKF